MTLCPSFLVVFFAIFAILVLGIWLYVAYKMPVSRGGKGTFDADGMQPLTPSNSVDAKKLLINVLWISIIVEIVVAIAFYYLFNYMCTHGYNTWAWVLFGGLVLLNFIGSGFGVKYHNKTKDGTQMKKIEPQHSEDFEMC